MVDCEFSLPNDFGDNPRRVSVFCERGNRYGRDSDRAGDGFIAVLDTEDRASFIPKAAPICRANLCIQYVDQRCPERVMLRVFHRTQARPQE